MPQVNARTAPQGAVTYHTSDVVTVTSHPGYHNYTIGGKAARPMYQLSGHGIRGESGFVVIFGTATSYLLSIKAVLNAYQGSGQPTTRLHHGLHHFG
jgi:hypothetical protein